MAKKGFFLRYDPKTDVLDVSFGKAQKAISVEQEPEVYYRVNPNSSELVGLTVLGFKGNFLGAKQELNLSPELISQVIKENGFATT